jgi:ABC-type nitrate/sulfonate/bicarbonate transport system permease component
MTAGELLVSGTRTTKNSVNPPAGSERGASAPRSGRAKARRRREATIRILLRLLILGIILGAWQIAGDDEVRLNMPTFTGTMTAMFDMIADGSLQSALWITNQALIVGYSLALLVSLPLGIAMGSNLAVERVATPYLVILQAVPMIAVVPIVQAVFGLTFSARVMVVFLFSFIYVTINTMVGVRTVDVSLTEMSRSFVSTRRQRLRFVVLPAAVPGIMSGVRLGLGRAMIGMVVAELSLIGAGVGSLILDYQVTFRPANVFAILFVVVLEGVILMEIARRLEARLGRWRGGVAVE